MQIKNKFSDLTAEISKDGWVTLDAYGISITLGNYPNARFRVIEEMLEKVKKMKEIKK